MSDILKPLFWRFYWARPGHGAAPGLWYCCETWGRVVIPWGVLRHFLIGWIAVGMVVASLLGLAIAAGVLE